MKFKSNTERLRLLSIRQFVIEPIKVGVTFGGSTAVVSTKNQITNHKENYKFDADTDPINQFLDMMQEQDYVLLGTSSSSSKKYPDIFYFLYSLHINSYKDTIEEYLQSLIVAPSLPENCRFSENPESHKDSNMTELMEAISSGYRTFKEIESKLDLLLERTPIPAPAIEQLPTIPYEEYPIVIRD